MFVQDSDWNSHLALFEIFSIPLVLTMDLKDVTLFSGRSRLEYHFSSRREKIEERIGNEGKKKTQSQEINTDRKIKSRSFGRL